MNLEEYKNTVKSVLENTKLFTDKLYINKNNEYNIHIKEFDIFYNNINIILNFLNNYLNFNILTNCIKKINNKENLYPLDNLCKNNIEKLNETYSILKEIIDVSKKNLFDIHISNFIQLIKRFNSKIKEKSFLKSIEIFEIMKHLDGHNKTLIILGPNGSGKTSLATYLKSNDLHIKVIPALKPLRATGNKSILFNSTLQIYNKDLYDTNQHEGDLLQKLIIALCNEHDDIAREYYESNETNCQKKDSTFNQVKKIFDNFFEVKLDSSAFSNKEIKIKKYEGNLFDFNKMSDGERAAFFYIATVLAAPKQSFIIVDEPENHLNPAIYNKLWNRLIYLRDDCQFIFISHTIDFIKARSNFELVRIKNFTFPNKFEFDFLGGTLEDIPPDYIVEILGSRKPLLFCEGNRTGYDYKIYENLFGEKYTIIATENCSNVEKCVFACNHLSIYDIGQTIGIIDSDMKSDQEIQELKSKNIFPLKCNEIEMLLIDEKIFKKVLNQVYINEQKFQEFKEKFFKKINDRKKYIIKRLVKTRIDEKLKNIFIDDKNCQTKEEMIDNLSEVIKKIDLNSIWEYCEDKINNILSDRDYNEAIRFCCLGHNEIIGELINPIEKNYVNIALGLLRENNELSTYIRSKYFPEITLQYNDI